MTLPTYELGGRTITVFEELYFSDGTLAASHLDKDDVDQQLKVIVPESAPPPPTARTATRPSPPTRR